MLFAAVRYIHFNVYTMKQTTIKKITLTHSDLAKIIMDYIRKNNVWLPENPTITVGVTTHNANWAEVTFIEEDESIKDNPS